MNRARSVQDGGTGRSVPSSRPAPREYNNAHITSVRDGSGREVAERIVLRLPGNQQQQMQPQSQSQSSGPRSDVEDQGGMNRRRLSSHSRLGMGRSQESGSTRLASSESFLKGPIDPAGSVIPLSDRPILCASSNRRNEVVFGSADHNCYAINLSGATPGEAVNYSSHVTKMTTFSKGRDSSRAGSSMSGLTHGEWVTSICHIIDGRTISGALDGSLCCWDRVSTDGCAYLTQGHSGAVSEIVSDISQPIAVSIGLDGNAALWNFSIPHSAADAVSTSAAIRGPRSASLSSDNRSFKSIVPNSLLSSGSDTPLTKCQFWGNSIVIGDKAGMLFLWDSRTSRMRTRLTAHPSAVSALALLPDAADGNVFLSGGSDGFVKHWDLRSSTGTGLVSKGKLHLSTADLMKSSESSGPMGPSNFRRESKATSSPAEAKIGGVSFICPLNDSLIVSSGLDGSIAISDLRKGLATPLSRQQLHTSAVSAVCVIGDRCIFSGDRNGQLLCLDAASGQCVYGLGVSSNGAPVRSIISLGGCLIAAGDDGNALLLDFY